MLLDNCKYQYPPAALLLMELLPHPGGQHVCSRDAEAGAGEGAREWPFKRWIDLSSRLALLATLWLAARLLLQGLAPSAGTPPGATPESPVRRRRPRLIIHLLVAALGLSFFPLVWSHTLGQIQVYLNLLMTAALSALLAGRSAFAGALLGLCCLFKPNYALFLGWALLRRQWRLGAALALVAAAGHGLALSRYGLAAHLEYLDFLRGLSRLGESYWANQSLTGLMHRWLDPASALQWADSAFGSSVRAQRPPPAFDWEAAGFPAYHAAVHSATVAFSLALLALAFWPAARAAHPLQRTLDLGVAVAACTMASPIVWWHHYGIFFALFALALAATLRTPERRSPAMLAALALAYALLGSAALRPEPIFVDRALGVLGSHGWFGALILLALLLRLRKRSAPAPSRRP
jgi:hypothetical protein